MSAIKRVDLSIKQKVAILHEIKNCTKQEICEKYGCSMDTLYRILRNRNLIIQKSKTCNNLSRKRDRLGKSKKVDKAISKWFDQMRSSGAAVSSNMIMEKAKQFANALNENFNPSEGWLYRWQRRTGISLRKTHAESQSTEQDVVVKVETILPSLIDAYNPEDTFTGDTTGLLFKALSSSTLERKKYVMSSKNRMTFVFLYNATSDYKKMFAVGKPRLPRCLKNKTLPFKYFSQNKSLVTPRIWREIVMAFNQDMSQQNRKVLLYVNNALSYNELSSNNVNISYLPPNNTCVSQPFNQGIICKFKTNYRQNIVQRKFCYLEAGKSIEDFKKSIDILTALHIANQAYAMIKSDTILNHFRKIVTQSFDMATIQNGEDAERDEKPTVHFNPEYETNFKNYVNFDNNLPCYASPNNNETASECESSSADSDNDENENGCECIKVATASNALDAISNLRNFLLSKNECIEELERIEQFIFKKCSEF